VNRWDIIESVLIAWVIIKLLGPSAEAELEWIRSVLARHRWYVVGGIALYVVAWNLWKFSR
jgi:hypothetical protein